MQTAKTIIKTNFLNTGFLLWLFYLLESGNESRKRENERKNKNGIKRSRRPKWIERQTEGRIGLYLLAMSALLSILTTQPLTGIGALILLRDIGWKSPWKSGLWAVYVCVYVCMCVWLTGIAGVLIYALQEAGVKSDVCPFASPEPTVSPVFTTVTEPWL